ncbi:MAG: prolyl oligopeptidase family serine peptidase [Dehalococcoidia bacterium]|nr:prolyl oligopeptidase family serine peptidase [Dehalococcoidia bacterium]
MPIIDAVSFTVDHLRLEGMLHLPPVTPPVPAVVVCHPHPMYGGSMHNLVVAEVCRCLNEQGIAALRFNFRGTGGSQGTHTDGMQEPDDVKGALSYLEAQEVVDFGRLGVAGYSFGAYVALVAGVADGRAKALCGIAPPVSYLDMSFLKNSAKPKLFIVGSRDEITPLEPFLALLRQLPGENSHEVLDGTDHFLAGYEERVAERVASFFKEWL